MRIIVIGNESQLELSLNRWAEHEVIEYQTVQEIRKEDLLVDFTFDTSTDAFNEYKNIGAVVLISNITSTLAEVQEQYSPECSVYGFNGEKTFFQRQLLELTSREGEEERLTKTMTLINESFEIVKDRVGMVTPRIIAMIINEAFYTLEEGTANRQDIDLGMKLGTNYPMGPFEWVEAWGIDRVFKLLTALKKETGDIRYEICPLLEKEYLNSTG